MGLTITWLRPVAGISLDYLRISTVLFHLTHFTQEKLLECWLVWSAGVIQHTHS